MKKISIIFIYLICYTYSIFANELEKNLVKISNDKYQYKSPGSFDFITNVPDDYMQLYNTSTDSENLWIWGVIAGSTALLWYYDDELVEWAQDLGNKLGIDGGGNGEETSKVLLSIGPYPILKYPTDTGSALYFIGDGSVHIAIALGFLGYGYFGDNTKAVNVGSQLFEGLIDVAITTQIIKHVTGRETPNFATEPRGKWDWFPNQVDYANNVANYDAYPSGHLATAMMTVTILSENYPDNIYILPIGYTLMGLLSFQMLNNGVHWASDYPLAIGIGYTFGRIISSRERDIAKDDEWSIAPKIYNNNTYGLALNYDF